MFKNRTPINIRTISLCTLALIMALGLAFASSYHYAEKTIGPNGGKLTAGDASPGTKLVIPKLAEKAEVDEGGDDGSAQITDEDLKEVYPVIVKKGETVGAYAKWGQISIDDIKRANRNIKSIDRIRVGDTVNLPLTAKQFRRFQELRKGD